MGINIRNPKEYCENYLYIRDKKQQLVKLKFKPAQENLYRIIKEEHQAGRPVPHRAERAAGGHLHRNRGPDVSG